MRVPILDLPQQSITGNKVLFVSSFTGMAISQDPFQCFPNELCLMTLDHLDVASVASVRRVCRRWAAFASTDLVWRSLYLREPWLSIPGRTNNAPTSSRYQPRRRTWKASYVARR